jgi:hypothetical protein
LSDKHSPLVHSVKKEIALFLGLLFFGLVVMPVGIWFVGSAVFGEYGGAGYADFFGNLSAKIRSGDTVAWFLVLSPWLAWQILRLAAVGWRNAGRM